MSETTELHQQKIITIDGREYHLDSLTDTAKSQIANVRIVDNEIARMEQQLRIYRTARAAYARALNDELAIVSSH